VTVIAAGERWPDNSLRVALEDLIGAGAIICNLAGLRSPEAQAAAAVFEQARNSLHETLAGSGSGIELIDRGYAADVALAARLDAYSCAPVFKDGVIKEAQWNANA
jgi:2-phosphosulfolactate phosphatase